MILPEDEEREAQKKHLCSTQAQLLETLCADLLLLIGNSRCRATLLTKMPSLRRSCGLFLMVIIISSGIQVLSTDLYAEDLLVQPSVLLSSGCFVSLLPELDLGHLIGRTTTQ